MDRPPIYSQQTLFLAIASFRDTLVIELKLFSYRLIVSERKVP